jgi:hypothetical protein
MKFCALKSCPHGRRVKVWADWWAEGEGKGDGWIGGRRVRVDGVMGLRVGFININDMYNNYVGKGVVNAYEAYEVK